MIIVQLIFCDCRTCVGPQMFAMRPHGRLPTEVAGCCVRPTAREYSHEGVETRPKRKGSTRIGSKQVGGCEIPTVKAFHNWKGDEI